MSIYDQPAKVLMREFADKMLVHGQTFTNRDAVEWFSENYPKLKSNTVTMHCDGMSINSSNRKHHPSIKHGSNHDLFFKLGGGAYRLWDPETDPAPKYKEDYENSASEIADEVMEGDDVIASSEFGAEKDLQSYLSKNLSALENGLRLYEDEGLTGIEYPVGGRFIDILAVDADDNFVVIELKVSKAYDRVVGQLLRYMGWVEKNISEGKTVRGWIIGREISEDLKLATERVPDISLFEYEISFKVSPCQN
jgi:endonuclease